MSSSILAKKLQQTVHTNNLDYQIQSCSESTYEEMLENTSIILISPQIRFLENRIKASVAHTPIQVAILDRAAFGTLNTQIIIEQIQSLSYE